MIVAIDGPAGSGKSTLAKLLAEKMGFLYLDTGAMYRALTLKLLKDKVDLDDKQIVVKTAKGFKVVFKDRKVFLDGEDVTLDIRLPEVEQNIFKAADIPEVRECMVKLQREIGKDNNLVLEGRDTTTVVFPHAELKVFLDADFGERVKRRAKDLADRGVKVDFADLKESLLKRDKADINREVGALRKAKDAVYLDTTGLSIDETLEKVYDLACKRMKI